MLLKKLSAVVYKLKTDDSFANTVMVTVALVVAGFFGYVLQIYLGRKLSLAEYGIFNALLSLLTLLTFFNTGIALSATKVVSELFGEKKLGVLGDLFWRLATFFGITGGILLIVLNIFKTQFMHFLNIAEPSYIFFFSTYLVVRYLSVPTGIYLQGLLKFKELSYYTTFSSLIRTIVLGTLAYFGYKVGALYLGMSVAEIISLLITSIFIKEIFTKKSVEETKPQLKRIMELSWPVTSIYFSLLFFYNIDILMVQRFFDADSSGLYVGAATMGKIILFGTGAIATVMFPQISAMKAKRKAIAEKLKIFTLLQVGTIVVALAFFCFFPKFITFQLFGARYSGSIQMLPLYAVFISLNVLINFIVRFLMAVDKLSYSYLLLGASLVQVVLLFFFHTSLQQILLINTAIMFVLLIYLGFLIRPYFRPT